MDGGWMTWTEMEAAYNKIVSMNGKKPVALEVVSHGDDRLERFLFELPTDREPHQLERVNLPCRFMPIYVYIEE